MTPAYHEDLVRRAKALLAKQGRDWRTGKPFLLASNTEIIALIHELVFLIDADNS